MPTPDFNARAGESAAALERLKRARGTAPYQPKSYSTSPGYKSQPDLTEAKPSKLPPGYTQPAPVTPSTVTALPSEARASMIHGVEAYAQPKEVSTEGLDYKQAFALIGTSPSWTPELQAQAKEMQRKIDDLQQNGSRSDIPKQKKLEEDLQKLKYTNDPYYKAWMDAPKPKGGSGWNDFRDSLESAAVVAGNVVAPGSSLLTSKLASEGAQETLSQGPMQVAQLVAAGLGFSGVVAPTTAAPAASTGTVSTSMPLTPVEGYTAGTTTAGGMPLNAVEGYTAGTTAAPSLTSTIVDGAVEGALKGAARGALASTLTGGDALEGAKRGLLGGAVGGGVGATIGNVMPSVAIEGHPDITAAIDSGVKGSLTQGTVAAVTGGNVGDAMLSGGLIGAVTPSIEKVLPKDENPILNPTVAGAVGGGIDAGVTGGSVVNGIVTGALGGLGGAVGGEYGGTVGAITGGVLGNVIGNEIAPVHTPSNPAVMPSKYVPGTMSKMSSIVKDQPKNLGNYESLAVTRAKQRRS